jgi:integrase
MFALTYPVCQVAFSSGELEVSSAMVRGITKTTKTKLSTRKVSLIAPAREALLDVLRGQDPSNERCFLSPATGDPWADDAEYRRVWIKVLEKAGVRYRNPYQTRHTFASMMLMAGEPEMWVASQMGHADWSMVRKVYGKWIPAAAQDAGQRGAEFITKLVEART